MPIQKFHAKQKGAGKSKPNSSVTTDKKVKVISGMKNSSDRRAVSRRTHKMNKCRTSVSFRRPHTLRLKREPKYPRSTAPVVPKKDMFSIIHHPLTTELCMKKLEDSNTLTFVVDSKSTKHAIKKAIKARYDVVASKVTTLNMPTGNKKAYVKLTPEIDAIEVANR
ncbi:hypothetical protein MXB_5462, partial [Myxobolus squamalis]